MLVGFGVYLSKNWGHRKRTSVGGVIILRHNLATRMKFFPLTTPEPLGLGIWNFFWRIISGYQRVGIPQNCSMINILFTFGPVSPKRCKIGGKLVLITNRKSNMSFRTWTHVLQVRYKKCYRPSVCRLSVCLLRLCALYSAGWHRVTRQWKQTGRSVTLVDAWTLRVCL